MHECIALHHSIYSIEVNDMKSAILADLFKPLNRYMHLLFFTFMQTYNQIYLKIKIHLLKLLDNRLS